MRFSVFALSFLALLAFSSSASAFAGNMTTTYAGEGLNLSDTVTVDVFLDADQPTLTLLSWAVLHDATGELVYDGAASAALTPNPLCVPPTCGPGTSGAQPSYILFTPAGPMSMPPATALYPQQSPAWLNWPFPAPGLAQINLNYAEPSFNGALATGTGVYIASLVFRVASLGDGVTNLQLCNSGAIQSGGLCPGTILQIGGLTNPVMVPPSDVPLTGTPVVVNLPEPAIASLALAGLATLYFVRRRRT